MKKSNLLYVAMLAFSLTACSDQEIVDLPSAPVVGEMETNTPDLSSIGSLLIKFKPEMTEILKQTQAQAARTRSVMTRSGLPSTDEVLEIIGAYQLERVFPVDASTEERTVAAGMHLWYEVKFDENTNVNEAVQKLGQLGEIAKIQKNKRIQPSFKKNGYRSYINETALMQKSATRAGGNLMFSDPGLAYQWHYNNTGSNPFDYQNALNNASVEGCDVGLFEAWKKTTGDASIIVAVLDEGVMFTHPDLVDNMWINEGEELGSGKDADGNGYAGDKYGFNFVNNTPLINWTAAGDAGHGTHVAGTIAAANNGLGVCGIAGGNGSANSGVKIMSCQVFSSGYGVTIAGEARAIKYAADNGAVILQCSWGMNSGDANIVEGFTPGPSTQKEWEKDYPLEKEALDYFINNAGSPNGVIDGGLAIFAAGNEYANIPAFPGAYDKAICVGAVAPDFTPACYSDYGVEVDLSAPGGDTEAYGALAMESPNRWEEGVHSASILSTWVVNGNPTYGYMDGTSMACPHVSGVAALGLSYAVQQRRHFKASQFKEILLNSVKPIDQYYTGGKSKLYYRNHESEGGSPNQLKLSNYIGKMGAGVIDANMLLNNIEGKGADMKVPNIYVDVEATSVTNLASFFVDGENLTYTCTSTDATVATVSVEGTLMKVSGVKNGTAQIRVQTSNGSEQTIVVTVRKGANDNGWM